MLFQIPDGKNVDKKMALMASHDAEIAKAIEAQWAYVKWINGPNAVYCILVKKKFVTMIHFNQVTRIKGVLAVRSGE